MFNPQQVPRVFGIPVGCNFSKTFVQGLLEKCDGKPPEYMGRIEVFVNTERMSRRLHELLTKNGATLLPKIRVMTKIASHPDMPLVLPAPMSKLRRQLILAQLVGQLLQSDGTIAPNSAKYDLAASLAGLLDEMQGEGIPVQDLTKISVTDESGHWQRSMRFLSILAEHWNADAPVDPADRQRCAATAFARHWKDNPPDHPVLAIGSTGSRGETAVFLRAVANLPNGAVVLPGIDRAMNRSNWESLSGEGVSVDNPQSMLAGFCKSLGLSAYDVPDWSEQTPNNRARNALMSLAMRPAPFTDEWLDEGPKLRPELNLALEGLSLVEADTPREEAAAIALQLCKAAHDGQKAVLITPDRTLSRRVTAFLQRWDILPDDSAGRPLHLTPPGTFLRMIAATIGQRLTPLSLVGLLKHPLSDSGSDKGDSKRYAREFEAHILRGGAPFVDLESLRIWADKDTKDAKKRVWADWVVRCFEALEQGADTVLPNTLDGFLELHLTCAQALASGPMAALEHELWRKDTGETAESVFAALREESDAAGEINAADYRALIDTQLRGEMVRETIVAHPLISIWGTLEARVESADLVILGGMNDTIWPGLENPDPWLNRAMRKQIGLPAPERLIGLSAHDFQQASGAKTLTITRAVRDGDAPTVASRWIVRLLNLLKGLGDDSKALLNDAQERGQKWVDIARKIDVPNGVAAPAVRPAPVPPAEARIKKLSVTQIERLIRDPYAVYAQKVLNLRRLDPLGREPDALIRGIALHKVVETFVDTYPDALPDTARDALLSVAEKVLQDEVPWPAIQRIWLARLARVAGWFVEEENSRRQNARTIAQECSGQRRIEEFDFTLTAKADRIDQDDEGGLLIYDYKSGSPPSADEIKYFKKQLQLEAAIATSGGFDKVPLGHVAQLEYIGLSGASLDAHGKTEDVPTSPQDADAVWQELRELIGAYSDPSKGFPARPRMQKMAFAYEYDHLSRKGEWEESDAPVDIPVGEAH